MNRSPRLSALSLWDSQSLSHSSVVKVLIHPHRWSASGGEYTSLVDPAAGPLRRPAARGPAGRWHEAIVQPLRTERKAPPGAPRPSGRSPPVLPQAGRPQTCPPPTPPAGGG